MDTIKLTPAQLTEMMLLLRAGAGLPRDPNSEQQLAEEIRNSYHPGKPGPIRYQPKPATRSISYYEEKLHEAEEVIRQKDSRLAAMDKLLQAIQRERDKDQQTLEAEVERLKSELGAAVEANHKGQKALAGCNDRLSRQSAEVRRLINQLSQSAENVDQYRTKAKHSEQELEHLRNYAKDATGCIEEMLAAIYGQTSIVGGDVHARTVAELQNIGYQLSQLLKEAKRE